MNLSHKEESFRIEFKAYRAAQARIRRNRNSGIRFEENMFEASSRYLLLHLTVNYSTSFRSEITYNLIRQHRDRFFRHIEDYPNPLLQGIRGIIWRLEEGEESGGLHLHLLIFYSAHRKADIFVARDLGEYWVKEVTRGWGDYWNSNAHKDTLKRWGVGLGQVNRKDSVKRTSLRSFIFYYLTKANQVPRDRSEDDKIFGTRAFQRLSSKRV